MKKKSIIALVIISLFSVLFRPVVFLISSFLGAEIVASYTKLFVYITLSFETVVPVLILILIYRSFIDAVLNNKDQAKYQIYIFLNIVSLLIIGHLYVGLLIDLSPLGSGGLSTYAENILYSATPFYR